MDDFAPLANLLSSFPDEESKLILGIGDLFRTGLGDLLGLLRGDLLGGELLGGDLLG